MTQNGTKDSIHEAQVAASLSQADKVLLDKLAPDERAVVLWAVSTYPDLSVEEAIIQGRAGGM